MLSLFVSWDRKYLNDFKKRHVRLERVVVGLEAIIFIFSKRGQQVRKFKKCSVGNDRFFSTIAGQRIFFRTIVHLYEHFLQ